MVQDRLILGLVPYAEVLVLGYVAGRSNPDSRLYPEGSRLYIGQLFLPAL